MTKPNITEIARRAGVSTATVSRALNNKELVHEVTRKRIFEIAREVDYRPSHSLGTLNSRTKAIALILPEILDEFYASFLSNIEKKAINEDYYLLVVSSASQRSSVEDLIDMLTGMNVEGILIMAPMLHEVIDEVIAKCKLPVVAINAGKNNKVPTFNIGNYQGAYALTEHLISHQYNRIATIRGSQGNYDAEERFRGYCDALEAYDIPVNDDFIVSGDFTDKGGFYAFSRLMSLREKPDAVFAANDMMAIGAYKAAKNLNLKIPDDIAIAGFDDIHIGTIISPPLTTVHVPTDELGTEAFHHLLKLINNKDQDENLDKYFRELVPGIIIRESCGCKISSF